MEIDTYKKQEYKPEFFLTVYSNEEDNKYMEVGPIVLNDGKYEIGSSSPVDMTFLTNLVDSVKTETFKALRFKSLIPKNVVYFHSENKQPEIMWYRESETRYLYFNEEMGISTGDYQMPCVLFHLNDECLYVYRLLNCELDLNSPLYVLPLPNIYDNNSVCLGSTESKMKKPKYLEDVILNYEELFYKTEFNALHMNNPVPEGEIYVDAFKNKDLSTWHAKITNITLKTLLK